MLTLKPSKYLAQFIDVNFSPINHRALLVSLINSVCPLNKHLNFHLNWSFIQFDEILIDDIQTNHTLFCALTFPVSFNERFLF